MRSGDFTYALEHGERQSRSGACAIGGSARRTGEYLGAGGAGAGPSALGGRHSRDHRPFYQGNDDSVTWASPSF